MKLFCSNAVTGEDNGDVVRRMRLVVDTLNAAGHEAYCPVFDPHQAELVESGDIKAVLLYDFENIQTCDGVVVVVTSPKKSEGQLMEVGEALAAGKPIFLFLHNSAQNEPSHLPKIATKVFAWQTEDDLQLALQQL